MILGIFHCTTFDLRRLQHDWFTALLAGACSGCARHQPAPFWRPSGDPRHQAADKTRSLDDPEAQELCWRKRGLHTDTGTNELGSMRCQYRPVTVCRMAPKKQRKRPQVQQLIGAAFGVAVADDDIKTTPSAASSSAPEEAELEKSKRYSSTVRQLCAHDHVYIHVCNT